MTMRDDKILFDVPDVMFDRVWNFARELGEEVRHFNTLQSHYRSLASTWLLAAFGAVGFVYSRDTRLSIPVDVAAAGIALAAAIGLVLIWILDVLVYHQLLVANYEERKALEDEYRWLPQVCWRFAELSRRGPVRERITTFYVCSFEALLLIAGAALIRYESQEASPLGIVVAYTIAVGIGVGVSYAMRETARRDFRQKAKVQAKRPSE